MSYTLETFIHKANQIHNNKYDYNKTVYKNIKETNWNFVQTEISCTGNYLNEQDGFYLKKPLLL